jgi:hypothetical protein
MTVKNGENTAFDAQKGKGRPKGAVNKNTAALKDMILAALDKAGGADYLLTQAQDNPNAFLSLVGKVLPMTVTGGDGGPITLNILTGVPRATDD